MFKDLKLLFYYRIIWLFKDLIEEYIRLVRVIRNGVVIIVDLLGEIREVNINGMEFEVFVSDGLRSLLESVRVEIFEEWIFCWLGYFEKMRVFCELGFFREENFDFILKVIFFFMSFESLDFLIMLVEGEGVENGERKRMFYFLYDEEKDGFILMSRVMGFIVVIIVRIVVEGSCIYGVILFEILGMWIDIFFRIVGEICERGIMLEEVEGNVLFDNS